MVRQRGRRGSRKIVVAPSFARCNFPASDRWAGKFEKALAVVLAHLRPQRFYYSRKDRRASSTIGAAPPPPHRCGSGLMCGLDLSASNQSCGERNERITRTQYLSRRTVHLHDLCPAEFRKCRIIYVEFATAYHPPGIMILNSALAEFLRYRRGFLRSRPAIWAVFH